MSELTWLQVRGAPEDWRALGFEMPGDVVHVGRITLEVGADELAWGFERMDRKAAEALGVPTKQVEPQALPAFHPNGITRVDHVVYAVPSLDDGIEAFEEALSLEPRRRARPRGPEGPEMAFFRSGDTVIEMVEGTDTPALWGVALRSEDLDATVAAVKEAGGPIGEPKPAVQGGRIATVPKHHVEMPLAILEPGS